MTHYSEVVSPSSKRSNIDNGWRSWASCVVSRHLSN